MSDADKLTEAAEATDVKEVEVEEVTAEVADPDRTQEDDTGNTTPVPPVPPKTPDELLEEAQKQLEEAQKKLEEAKNRKTVEDARKKILDAIHGQQAASKLVVDDATQASERWQKKIDEMFPEKDHKAERDDIQDKINDAMQAVKDAEAEVNRIREQIIDDEFDQKGAEAQLVVQQKYYADVQKEFSQFAAKIKDSQAGIEKLRIEVNNAIGVSNWERAFGKNHQLKNTITDANQLIDTAQEETRIVDELKQLEANIKTAQNTVTTMKKKVEDDTAALKAAEADLKEKRDGLANTITSAL